VAFLSYAFGKDFFGVGKYGWYLVNELRNLGASVDVFTTKVHLKSLGPPLFYIRKMSLKLKNYDLVHSNEGAGLFLYHPCMIETYHHDYKQCYDVYDLVFHLLETLQLRKVGHIIAPSFGTENNLLRLGLTKDKISVIHHGVDHSVFKKDESSRTYLRRKYGISNLFAVINVGRLIKRKTQIEIIKALEGVPQTTFVLVGDGEEEKNIKKMAQKSGVRLIHFKHVSERSLVDLYNVADVYVHTSVLEGFGLTVLEAMACGLPVIAYKTADFETMLGGAGFLLKRRDIDGIKQSIEVFKHDQELRKRMSEIAQQKSKEYTWRKTAEEHLKVYEKMLAHL
jgi:glycosyltransferase involved in cell wall biosynthesis